MESDTKVFISHINSEYAENGVMEKNIRDLGINPLVFQVFHKPGKSSYAHAKFRSATEAAHAIHLLHGRRFGSTSLKATYFKKSPKASPSTKSHSSPYPDQKIELFITKIADEVSPELLEEMFRAASDDVIKVTVKRVHGIQHAWVEFHTIEQAEEVLSIMDGIEIKGKKIKVALNLKSKNLADLSPKSPISSKEGDSPKERASPIDRPSLNDRPSPKERASSKELTSPKKQVSRGSKDPASPRESKERSKKFEGEVAIYVSEIPAAVQVGLLEDIFRGLAPEGFLSAHITRKLGLTKFGFVNYSSLENAEYAVELAKDFEVMGKHLKVSLKETKAQRESRESTKFSVIVSNLDRSVTKADLLQFFKGSCKGVLGASIDRNGLGFVDFESQDQANAALTISNVTLHGKPLKLKMKKINVKATTETVQELRRKLDDAKQMQLMRDRDRLARMVRIKKSQDEVLELRKKKEEKEKRKVENLRIEKEISDLHEQLQLQQVELEIKNYRKQIKVMEEEKSVREEMEALSEKRLVEKLKRELAAKEKIFGEIAELRDMREAVGLDLDTTPINWDSDAGFGPWEKGTLESFRIDSVATRRLVSVSREAVQVRLKERPFGVGSFRLAYHMKTSSGGRFVAKSLISSKGKERDMEIAKENMETLHIAKAFAENFNEKASLDKKLDYVDGKILTLESKGTMMVEEVLAGVFIKFNNNGGHVHETKNGAPQAFSHFTYHISSSDLLIVDIQGVKTPRGYQLTDPAIQSKNTKKYGSSNMGENGIADFFKTHRCNQICRHLGLAKHARQTEKDEITPTLIRK
eukprot:TRINITY_DN9431_c0_g1_i1.p1 TRINITY_DN9431_c0_g1~~TRINITY_DN9431_c0_g1_i1.p1  ORF type:complete len:819 (-),score=201.46 TRINITY_DN9431_c0_g1_i1:14-2446(-)